VVCPRCGNNVSDGEASCPNCGADLDRGSRDLESGSDNLRKMSEELQAVTSSTRIVPSGERLADRFEVGELVGEGPFGQVYRATDELAEAKVALKVFAADLLTTPPEEESFLRATASARKMTQRNVVRLHDSGIANGHPWVSMQYLEGLSLRKTLRMRERKDERFDLQEAEPLVSQVTMAVQHIGRETPVGDLKPSNIFFLPDLVKVSDGYLLSALPPERFVERLDESRYLAPEIRRAPEEADRSSDVYSLGMILGEMMFGPDYSPGSTDFVAERDRQLDRLCRRATAEDPAERYDNLEVLSEDFSTLVDTGQLLERSTGREAGPMGGAPGEPPADPAAGVPSDEMATREYDREGGEHPPVAPESAPHEGAETAANPGGATSSRSTPASSRSTPESAEPRRSAGQADGDERTKSPGLFVLAGLSVIGLLAVGIALYVNSDADGGAGDEEVVSAPKDENQQSKGAAESGEQQKKADDGLADALAQAGGTVEAAVGDAGNSAGEAVEDARESNDEETADEQSKQLAAKGEADEGDEHERESGAVSGSSAEETSTGSTAAAAGSEDKTDESGEREATEETSESAVGSAESADKDDGRGGKAGDCPGSMIRLEAEDIYCIDRYEFPGAGSKPRTNVTWFEAKSLCEDQGKRLCTLREWRRSCGSKYPWGGSWDPNKCNTADEAGFGRSLRPTGKQKSCRSYSGTYDMVGNAFEWTKNQQVAGGGFRSGPETASCRYSSPKEPGSSSPAIGFRCCADPG